MYIIATTPRTGGHLLCDLLSSTAVCGRPTEYVLLEAEHIWRNIGGCQSRQEYLNYYLRNGWSDNGVFGAKLTWGQFCQFTADLARTSELDNQSRASVVEQAFGGCRYIFLGRRDQVRQAISYSRALQTGRWNSRTVSMTNAPAEEIYDVNAIDQLVRAIRQFESLWLSYLHGTGVNYLQVFYEDLVHEPRIWIARIMAFLGVDHAWAGGCRSELQRQSDGLTEEWVTRYRVSRTSP
jgi:trehalose 2-sulfotransferase